MPARRELDPKEAISHLKKIYRQFVSEGGDPNRFTIRHYNALNSNPHMYIDVYVKKMGGWNTSLSKAGIPLGFRQYREYSREEVAAYVKKVYKIKLASGSKRKPAESSGNSPKGQDKTFRMTDYTRYNAEAGGKFSLAIVLKRFGTWSKVLKELNIPIGRSRGLSQSEISAHLMKVYDRFRKKEGIQRTFSKEMYDKYNLIDEVYISSKLIERRYGSWLSAKKKLKIY